MADERTITTVFRADISQFSASTQDLNRYMKQVNSEFNNATASMSRWNDNTQGLRAKITQLNSTLDVEKIKLKSLEEQYNALTEEQKQNSVEGQNLATQINNQGAKVQKVERDIKSYTASLNELESAGVNTKQELDDLNKSMEEQAKTAQNEAAAANKRLAEEQQKAAEEAENLSQKLADQKQEAKETGSQLVKGVGLGLTSIVAGCLAAVKGLSSVVEQTKELRTQLGQLETAFETNDLSAESATKTYDELYSVLGDSGKATEASMHIAQLAKSEEDLSDYTHILTGVYATFGDSLPIENLSEGIQTTLTLGKANAGMNDALEFMGVSVDDFNAELQALNTEEEKSAFIKETLNGLYGESATLYKENNADIISANDAQNKYNQTMAEIAEKVQPAMTEFKLTMIEVLQTIMNQLNETDISGLLDKISGAITTIVNVALPPLISAITWIINNINWLAPLLATLLGSLVAITSAIKIYNGVMKTARLVQLAFNLALAANPIGLVVIAIAGLVTAFVLLWNKCEGFRNFFVSMWEKIKEVSRSAGEFIKNIFETIGNGFKGFINGITSAINSVIKAINKISVKVPDWVPGLGGKKFGFDIPTIPQLAKGGIVNDPTLALIGEKGREAVMPLDRNTEWIDKLASKINSKQSSSSVVNNYNVSNKFENMETSRLALHKSNLELKRLIGG